MRVTNARDILGRSGKLYDVNRLGNQVGSARPKNMYSQHAIRAGIGDDLDPTIRFIEAARPAVGGERKLADAIFLAALFGLFFGQSHAGDLRPGVNHSGNSFVINMSFLSRQALGE